MGLNNIISLILIPLGILCLFRPFLLLYLFVTLSVLTFAPAISHQSSEFKIIQVGAINIFAQDYLILIMVILLLYNFVVRRYPVSKLFASPVTKVVIAVFFWNIFIGLLSYLKGFNLQNVLRNLSTASLMFIAILIPQIEDIDIKKERFFQFGIILGVIVVSFALWRYGISHEVQHTSSGTIRTLQANAVVIFMLPVCYILFYSNYWRSHRTLSLSIIVLLAIGIHFTGHRSGLVVLLFVLIMWFFWGYFKKLDYLWLPLWSAALLMTVILILPMYKMVPGQSLFGDLVIRADDTFNLENSTTQDRLSIWKYSVEIIKENPLLGLGRFPVYTAHMDEESNFNLRSFAELERGAHNIFFHKLIHEGLLGLSVIIIFFYVILKQFRKASFLDERYARFLKVYMLSFILFCMFNTSFTNSIGRIFFFIPLGFLNAEILKDSLSTGKLRHSLAPIPSPPLT